jgi:hypothetical protein
MGPKRRGRAPLLCALISAAFAISCGSIEGTDPYALWRTYEDPGRAYHFHFPAPPWVESSDAAFGLPVFVVDPDNDPLAPLPAARLRLEARMFVPADLDAVVSAETAVFHEQGFSTSPPVEFLSAAADVGVLLEARRDDLWVRQVFHEELGTVVTLRLWGTSDDPLSEDNELLLESFEPRGAGGD